MNRDFMRNALKIMIILASFLVFILYTQLLWILVGIQIIIVIYFITTDFSSFVHSLFWPLFLASQLVMMWPLSFIIPLAVYLIIILLSKKMRDEISWLKLGKIDKLTIYIMIPTILISSMALIIWTILAEPDISDIKNMIPAENIFHIVIIGLLFSVFNSIWEEMILKGILWNGLERITSSMLIINIFQAILFGILHLNGFPSGIIGAIMAGMYGLLIGFIRKQSNGLLAPIITHFFADATIFGIAVAIKL